MYVCIFHYTSERPNERSDFSIWEVNYVIIITGIPRLINTKLTPFRL